MESIKNLLTWINENWASLVTIAVLIYGIYKKAEKTITEWKAKSEEEKQKAIEDAKNKAIEVAKNALKEYILVLVAKAEVDWNESTKLGPIKRAQVIAEIFAKYPILEEVTNQEELLAYIDELINEALKTVREKIRNSDDSKVE